SSLENNYYDIISMSYLFLSCTEICIAIVVFLIFWLLTKLFKFFVRKTLENRSYTRQNLVLVLNRVGSTAILFFGFLIALVIMIPGFTPGQLMSALGIGSVAIGFAFKDIFQNLLSGILILLSEPFRIGDSIVVNSLEGTVEDIQIRATFLRSPDGRRIVIPNATVYTSALTVNTAYQQRRCEFVVGIGYDDDEQKAKQIILDILNNDRNVLSQPAFSVNVTALADFSVNLTVRWWVDTTETDISSSISNIQAQVKQAFNENDIDIPYPIQELKMVSNPPALNPETSAKQTT
ncbi:mechanosensitive ion channel family protein, partial [Acinetobacter baumannii]